MEPREDLLSELEQRRLLLELLYRALIDIRAAAHESGDKKSFALADIFHNVPSGINRALDGKRDFGEILRDVRVRVERRNAEGWLDNAIADIARWGKLDDIEP